VQVWQAFCTTLALIQGLRRQKLMRSFSLAAVLSFVRHSEVNCNVYISVGSPRKSTERRR
jgi:hypothetical protein